MQSLRSRFKFIAILFASLFVFVWIASLVWDVSYSNSDWSLGAQSGCLLFSSYAGTPADIRALRRGEEPPGKLKGSNGNWGGYEKWTFAEWRCALGIVLPRINRFQYSGSYYPHRLPVNQVTVVVPVWVPLAVTLAWLTLLIMRFRRRRMVGCCRNCLYDLKGNQSGICPECGTPASTEPAAHNITA